MKLLDYSWDDLESNRNPFAVIVEAHRMAQATRKDMGKRLDLKLALVRRLNERGESRQEIRRLFRFADWILTLPEDLDERFLHELAELEESKHMPYITSAERFGIEKGRLEMAREAVADVLETRFGRVSADMRERILPIADVEALRALHTAAVRAESLEEFKTFLEGHLEKI